MLKSRQTGEDPFSYCLSFKRRRFTRESIKMNKTLLLFLLIASTQLANCGILDFLSLEEDDDAPQKRDRESDCVCQNRTAHEESTCACCVDLNFSGIEGGTVCTKMKYLSQEEGISVNVSLGKTVHKSATITVDKADDVCLSVIGGLAKMCAKFDGLAPSASGGLIGCLKMQPKIFGEVPLDFDFPCFDMMADEIKIIDAPKKVVEDETKEESDEGITNSTSDSEETIGGFKVEDILNVVSKTADQGIKIISELFGVGEEATEATPAESKSEPETPKNGTKSP